MPAVTFLPKGKTIEVPAGVTLRDAALQAGLPVGSSCDGKATCGKCNMRIVEGEGAGLTPRLPIEDRLLKKERRPMTDRISCVAKVIGDCSVTTTYW